jgi:peroxiredoxin
MRFAVLFLGVALCLPAQFAWRRAPGFSLPDLAQKQHDLADYRGKVVVLDIMKTDCPKCQEITPLLEQVKTKYGADKVQVLSVVTMPDNLQSVKAYAAKFKVTSPMLFDCGQMIASYLKVGPSNPSIHLPTVFVIDKNGFIRTQIDDTDVSPAKIIGSVEAALR